MKKASIKQFNMKNRLFVFGCSMAKYAYGTWADYLSANFDEYYNFGRPGSSMPLIMSKLVEADSIYDFNPDSDYVAVMFTGIGRWSYMNKHNSLQTHGDLLHHAISNPDRKEVVWYVENMWSEKWLIYNAWIAAKTIKTILKYKNIQHKLLLGLNYSWYTQKPKGIDDEDVARIHNIVDIVDVKESLHSFYQDICENHKHITPSEYWENIKHEDGHPSQYVHYLFMKKTFPEFDTYKSKEIYELCKNNFVNISQSVQNLNFDEIFRKKYDYTYRFPLFGE